MFYFHKFEQKITLNGITLWAKYAKQSEDCLGIAFVSENDSWLIVCQDGKSVKCPTFVQPELISIPEVKMGCLEEDIIKRNLSVLTEVRINGIWFPSYMMEQEKHDKKRTFKNEYLDLLKNYEVKFDEQYLFQFYE